MNRQEYFQKMLQPDAAPLTERYEDHMLQLDEGIWSKLKDKAKSAVSTVKKKVNSWLKGKDPKKKKKAEQMRGKIEKLEVEYRKRKEKAIAKVKARAERQGISLKKAEEDVPWFLDIENWIGGMVLRFEKEILGYDVEAQPSRLTRGDVAAAGRMVGGTSGTVVRGYLEGTEWEGGQESIEALSSEEKQSAFRKLVENEELSIDVIKKTPVEAECQVLYGKIHWVATESNEARWASEAMSEAYQKVAKGKPRHTAFERALPKLKKLLSEMEGGNTWNKETNYGKKKYPSDSSLLRNYRFTPDFWDSTKQMSNQYREGSYEYYDAWVKQMKRLLGLISESGSLGLDADLGATLNTLTESISVLEAADDVLTWWEEMKDRLPRNMVLDIQQKINAATGHLSRADDPSAGLEMYKEAMADVLRRARAELEVKLAVVAHETKSEKTHRTLIRNMQMRAAEKGRHYGLVELEQIWRREINNEVIRRGFEKETMQKLLTACATWWYELLAGAGVLEDTGKAFYDLLLRRLVPEYDLAEFMDEEESPRVLAKALASLGLMEDPPEIFEYSTSLTPERVVIRHDETGKEELRVELEIKKPKPFFSTVMRNFKAKIGLSESTLNESWAILSWLRKHWSLVKTTVEIYQQDPGKAKEHVRELEKQYGAQVQESIQEASEEPPSFLMKAVQWLWGFHPSTHLLWMTAVAMLHVLATQAPTVLGGGIVIGGWVGLLGWVLKLRGMVESIQKVSRIEAAQTALLEAVLPKHKAAATRELDAAEARYWKESGALDAKYGQLFKGLQEKKKKAIQGKSSEEKKRLRSQFAQKKKALKAQYDKEMDGVFQRWGQARDVVRKKYSAKNESKGSRTESDFRELDEGILDYIGDAFRSMWDYFFDTSVASVVKQAENVAQELKPVGLPESHVTQMIKGRMRAGFRLDHMSDAGEKVADIFMRSRDLQDAEVPEKLVAALMLSIHENGKKLLDYMEQALIELPVSGGASDEASVRAAAYGFIKRIVELAYQKIPRQAVLVGDVMMTQVQRDLTKVAKTKPPLVVYGPQELLAGSATGKFSISSKGKLSISLPIQALASLGVQAGESLDSAYRRLILKVSAGVCLFLFGDKHSALEFVVVGSKTAVQDRTVFEVAATLGKVLNKTKLRCVYVLMGEDFLSRLTELIDDEGEFDLEGFREGIKRGLSVLKLKELQFLGFDVGTKEVRGYTKYPDTLPLGESASEITEVLDSDAWAQFRATLRANKAAIMQKYQAMMDNPDEFERCAVEMKHQYETGQIPEGFMGVAWAVIKSPWELFKLLKETAKELLASPNLSERALIALGIAIILVCTQVGVLGMVGFLGKVAGAIIGVMIVKDMIFGSKPEQ
jgi:hypothetical protein